tara:strand:- start:15398 stop:18850 length:3453 start_codon:yes stop_codon:yes gene_type:complete
MAKERAEFDIVFSTGSAQRDITAIDARLKLLRNTIEVGNATSAQAEKAYRSLYEELRDYKEMIAAATVAAGGDAKAQKQLADILGHVDLAINKVRGNLRAHIKDQEAEEKTAEAMATASLNQALGYDLMADAVKGVTVEYAMMTDQGKSVSRAGTELLEHIDAIITAYDKEGRSITHLLQMRQKVSKAIGSNVAGLQKQADAEHNASQQKAQQAEQLRLEAIGYTKLEEEIRGIAVHYENMTNKGQSTAAMTQRLQATTASLISTFQQEGRDITPLLEIQNKIARNDARNIKNAQTRLSQQRQVAEQSKKNADAAFLEQSGYNALAQKMKGLDAVYAEMASNDKDTIHITRAVTNEITRLRHAFRDQKIDQTALIQAKQKVNKLQERTTKTLKSLFKVAELDPHPQMSKNLEQFFRNISILENAIPRYELKNRKLGKSAEKVTQQFLGMASGANKVELEFLDASGAGQKLTTVLNAVGSSGKRVDATMARAAIGQGGYTKSVGRTNAAISNASFALQDFLTVMQGGGGFERAVLSTTNNLGMMATMMFKPVTGAIVGVSAAVASFLLPQLMKLIDFSSDASRATKEWADTTKDKIEEIREAAEDAIALPDFISGQSELVKGAEFALAKFKEFSEFKEEAAAKEIALREKLAEIPEGPQAPGVFVTDLSTQYSLQERQAKNLAIEIEAINARAQKSAEAAELAARALKIQTFNEIEERVFELDAHEDEIARKKMNREVNDARRAMKDIKDIEETRVAAQYELRNFDVVFNPLLKKQLAEREEMVTEYYEFETNRIDEMRRQRKIDENNEEIELENQRLHRIAADKEFQKQKVKERSEADALIIDARKKFNKQIDDLIDDSDDRREKELKDLKANLQAQAFALGDAGKEFKRAMAKLEAELESIAKKKEEKIGPPGKPKPFLDRLQQINADRMAQGLDPIHARSKEGRAIRRQAHEDEKRFNRQQFERRRGQRGRARKAQRVFNDPASVGDAREETGRESGLSSLDLFEINANRWLSGLGTHPEGFGIAQGSKRSDLNRAVDEILGAMFTLDPGNRMRRGIVKGIDPSRRRTNANRGANAGAAFQGTVDKNQVLQEVVDLLKMAGETQSITNQSMAELIGGIDNIRARQHANKLDADNLKKNATTTTRRRSR